MNARQELSAEKRYQVFLSYASADRKTAQIIVDKLQQDGIRVWFDTYELMPGDSIAKTMEKAMVASDYLMVLLSPNSVNSVWVQELGSTIGTDLTARDITVLPVLIADCVIPLRLLSYQFLDLRTDFDRGMNQLVKQINVASEIVFSGLDWLSFEALVTDLLAKLGFTLIQRGGTISDFGFDVKAQYPHTDPFGIEVTDTWLVEIKFYKRERADLKTIDRFAGYVSGLPVRSKGLLITNGQLTSAAREWLKTKEAGSRVEIRVIDGTELKRLLLQHRDLIEKYFARD